MNPNIHHLAANHLPESGAHLAVACPTPESGIQGAAPIPHSPLFATVQRRDAPPTPATAQFPACTFASTNQQPRPVIASAERKADIRRAVRSLKSVGISDKFNGEFAAAC
jgi:hypothetical protein